VKTDRRDADQLTRRSDSVCASLLSSPPAPLLFGFKSVFIRVHPWLKIPDFPFAFPHSTRMFP